MLQCKQRKDQPNEELGKYREMCDADERGIEQENEVGTERRQARKDDGGE